MMYRVKNRYSTHGYGLNVHRLLLHIERLHTNEMNGAIDFGLCQYLTHVYIHMVGGENVTKSKNKNSYSNLNRLNTQELEALLQRDIEDSGGGNTDMVMYILETLERREGGISETDKEATARALKEFFSIYAIPEGEGLQLYPCAVLESEGLTAKKFLVNLLATIETQFNFLEAGTFLKIIFYAMRR